MGWQPLKKYTYSIIWIAFESLKALAGVISNLIQTDSIWSTNIRLETFIDIWNKMIENEWNETSIHKWRNELSKSFWLSTT